MRVPLTVRRATAGFTAAEYYDEARTPRRVVDHPRLAIRGWIRIERSKRLLFFSMKDYRLVRLPVPGQTLKPHEEKMLAGLSSA
jgi:hypothetical protein